MDEMLYIREMVKLNTQIIKVLGLIVLTTLTGVITLFYQWDGFTGKAFILAFFGLIAIFVLIWLVVYFYKRNVALIEKFGVSTGGRILKRVNRRLKSPGTLIEKLK